MLKAEQDRVILTKVTDTWPLQQVETGRPNRWQVVDGQGFKPWDIVFYIPHSAIEIQEDGTTYYAVPKDQVIASLLPNE